MIPTVLSYLDDSYCYESFSKIVSISKLDDSCEIVLDATIFYPQGGGQPSDFGLMFSHDNHFNVKHVRFEDGLVYHIGNYENGSFSIGDTVSVKIDEFNRIQNCRNHTAGHLVDLAMINCGFDFQPIKGYHFNDSPYVEYDGVIPGEDREAVMLSLENEANRLIGTSAEVFSFLVDDYLELEKHCSFIPSYLPKGKPVRVVKIAGVGCPCGGTHFKNLSELKAFSISKIKLKKGKTRINYRAE